MAALIWNSLRGQCLCAEFYCAGIARDPGPRLDRALPGRHSAAFVRHHLIGHFPGHCGTLDAAIRAIFRPCAAADADALRRSDSAREYAGIGAAPHAGGPDHPLCDARSSDSLLRRRHRGGLGEFHCAGCDWRCLVAFSLGRLRKTLSELR